MRVRALALVAVSVMFPAFASAVRCPDGSYVAGKQCKLTPGGGIVGGKSMKLCPDGKYVAGKRCKLQPDGSYTGED